MELIKLAAAVILYKEAKYKTKTHKTTKVSTPKSDAKKIASASSYFKKLQENNPYMPYIQGKLNEPAMAGLDRLLGRHEEKEVNVPNKYDGVRSRLKNLFNSLPRS